MALVNHHLLHAPADLPPPGGLYDYVVAGNGLFLHSWRAGLAALFPLTSLPIRGLARARPYFHLDAPRVPAAVVRQMLAQARDARDAAGAPVEILFHLTWSDTWLLAVPPQLQTATSVQVLPWLANAGPPPLIEVHSHHGMEAFWSRVDDIDEVGMALYAVLGRIFDAPQLRVRLGVYGYHWPIPATWVVDLPPEIADGYRGSLPRQPLTLPGGGDAQT